MPRNKAFRILITIAYFTLFIHLFKLLTQDTSLSGFNINYVNVEPVDVKRMLWQLKNIKKNLSSFAKKYKKPVRVPTDLKFILIWAYTQFNFEVLKNGQQTFLESKCEMFNCFITKQKSLFGDWRHFDAVLFDVEHEWEFRPPSRDQHQKYIFTASESANDYPICSPNFEDYYNMTWTYKLDSDIRWSYVTILDKNGEFVGPKINMSWIEDMKPISDDVKKILDGKSKTVAWFISNCNAKSNRDEIARDLRDRLRQYDLTLDIYGWCGNLTCPEDRFQECLKALQRDYYFYLSFENSLAEDYVSDKLLYPLNHYAVPIVYSGADYSRFLPPLSYLNVKKQSIKRIAYLMHKAVTNRKNYYEYFRWHNHYKYVKSPPEPDVCVLCRLLNQRAGLHSTVKDFRKWWNHDYDVQCHKPNIN